MRRLRNSARMMALLDCRSRDEELAGRIRRRWRPAAARRRRSVHPVLVTRGVGDLTYDPAATPHPSVVIIVKPHVDPPAVGLRRAAFASSCRRHPQPPRIGEPDDQEQQPDEQRTGHAGGLRRARSRESCGTTGAS
jgi:hypothetical protein